MIANINSMYQQSKHLLYEKNESIHIYLLSYLQDGLYNFVVLSKQAFRITKSSAEDLKGGPQKQKKPLLSKQLF